MKNDKTTVNRADIVSEVTQAFMRYEQALVSNDVEVLDELFWKDELTIRYGATENLYGYQAIQRFRASRPSKGLARELFNTVITTYGNDFAVAHTEFRRKGVERTGRQTQTWLRTERGWRIVSAHVSLLEPPSQP